jgi:protein involved in polysaccharide export with SLBB domain
MKKILVLLCLGLLTLAEAVELPTAKEDAYVATVVGCLNDPGKIQIPKEGILLRKLIEKAGGFQAVEVSHGIPSRIKITRKTEKDVIILEYRGWDLKKIPEFVVIPDDIIFVAIVYP